MNQEGKQNKIKTSPNAKNLELALFKKKKRFQLSNGPIQNNHQITFQHSFEFLIPCDQTKCRASVTDCHYHIFQNLILIHDDLNTMQSTLVPQPSYSLH